MASQVVHSTGGAASLGRPAAKRATLVFVRRYSSGASRRMESLVAWVKVTRKRHLDVLELDADRHSSLVAKLGVKTAPSLVLVKDRRVVGRIEGRASGRQIDELIRPHLQ
jgi:thioredoxin-like negative regulator of GroEL